MVGAALPCCVSMDANGELDDFRELKPLSCPWLVSEAQYLELNDALTPFRKCHLALRLALQNGGCPVHPRLGLLKVERASGHPWGLQRSQFFAPRRSSRPEKDRYTLLHTAMEFIRSKTAGSSCRERKRKCNGDLPCSYCVRNQHECSYDAQPRRGRRARNPTIPASEPWTEGPTQLQLLEANSPAVFVQRLASNSSTALPMALGLPCYAWNLGFGPELMFLPNVGDLTEILTVADMRHLATAFFSEISPVYDFLDRPAVEEAITRRWIHSIPYDAVDSLLLGIAALGCLFSPTQARGTELERHLVYSGRVTLEYSSQLLSPDVDHVVGWLQRVIYLRLTSTPHATWMASCILMHMVETTKLHFNSESDSILALSLSAATCPPERRRKIYHVAQLFNTWVSLDCGKSPVDPARGILATAPSWLDRRTARAASPIDDPRAA